MRTIVACRSWSGTCGMDMFCSERKKWARSHRTSRLSSVRLQCKGLLSFALLASEQTQNAGDVIDTMLFKCKRNCKLLSTVTRLIYSCSVSSDEICLESSPPACIGCSGFVFAVGPISTLGRSVTLVGPSARCQQRQNLALPNARRGTLHPSR